MALRRAPLAAAAVTAVLAGPLAGCGQGRDALTGVSPAQAVSRAASRSTSGSFRVDTAQTITFDPSRLSAAARQGFGKKQAQHQTIKEDVESAKRLGGVLSTDSRSGIHIVLYDGTVYVSPDGRDYKEAPVFQGLADTFSTHQVQEYADHIGGLKDRGRSTQDGVDTERFDGVLDQAYLSTLSTRLLGSLFSGLGAPSGLASSVGQAIHYDRADVTFYVDRASGSLVREASIADVSLDFDRLATLSGHSTPGLGGVLEVSTDGSTHLYDHGAHITVAHPSATGTISLQELGALFGSAPTG
ncbi:MAG TPA: hypothetical protein VGL20_19015 [Candidatus Dormibacteraeota bacterium]|jgi:hypothetical protein